MRNSLIGYANVTTRSLIQYLYQAYCNITSTQVTDNDKKLRVPYDLNQPIEPLYEQIDNDIAFAEVADNAYTGKQIVAIAYEIIFQTGIYADDCKLWRKKAKADKTWPEFKVYFTDAIHDLRQSKATAGTVGYHQSPADTIDFTRTLTTITTAIEAYQSTITNMTKQNQQLTNQLHQAITYIGTTNDGIATLKQQLNALTSGSSNFPPKTTDNDQTGRHTFNFAQEPKRKVYDNTNYCHTHGYHVNNDHTSSRCKNPKDGHQKEASRTNIMGGSTRGAYVCL